MDAVVLGITLWKTYYIFGLDKEARAAVRLTATVIHNGNISATIDMISLIDTSIRQYPICVGHLHTFFKFAFFLDLILGLYFSSTSSWCFGVLDRLLETVWAFF